MTPAMSFNKFKDQFTDWKTTFRVYPEEGRYTGEYQRIVSVSGECRNNTGGTHYHEYHAIINTNTGDIFTDCRKTKIYAKHFVCNLMRPLHTVIKTIWHASILGPLAEEIYYVAKGIESLEPDPNDNTKKIPVYKKNDFKQFCENMKNSCYNIFRTPFYGTAILIMHLVGTTAGIISPYVLYKTRELAGSLDTRLHKYDTTYEEIIRCFKPIKNITQYSARAYNVAFAREDFEALANGEVGFREKKRVLCNNFCLLHPKFTPYISASKRINSPYVPPTS